MLLFKTCLEKIKQKYKNSKLQIIAPPWNDAFDLVFGFYLVSDI